MSDNSFTRLIPINQGGSYYKKRAAQNRDAGRLFDALKLCKKALEAEKNDASLMLDTAVILSEMGLNSKSSKLITDAMLLGADDDKVYCAVCVNLLARGMRNKAENLRAQIKLDNQSSDALEKMFVSSDKPALWGYSRHERYAIKLLARAMDLASDDLNQARLLANKAKKLNPKSAHITALYSIALSSLNPTKAEKYAFESLNLIKNDKNSGAWSGIACAQALLITGNASKARKLLISIKTNPIPYECISAYIFALAYAGMHTEIYEYCVNACQNSFSTDLLHALSLSASAMRLPENKVLYGWNRILEADDNNIVCKRFIKAYRENMLTYAPEEYGFALTKQMLLEEFKAISNLDLSDDDLEALCYIDGYDRLNEIGIWHLISKGDKESLRKLSALAIRPDVSEKARLTANSALIAEADDTITKKYEKLKAGINGNADTELISKSIWSKRLYENLSEIINPNQSPKRYKIINENLTDGMKDTKLRKELMFNLSCAEAALVGTAVNSNEEYEFTKRLADYYRVPNRRLKYLMRRLKGARKG